MNIRQLEFLAMPQKQHKNRQPEQLLLMLSAAYVKAPAAYVNMPTATHFPAFIAPAINRNICLFLDNYNAH